MPELPTVPRLALILVLAVVGFVVGPFVDVWLWWRNRRAGGKGAPMPDSEPRCTSRHRHTGKRCVLVPGHVAGHRWWRVRDPERPSWMDGEGRIEWFEDEEVRDGR